MKTVGQINKVHLRIIIILLLLLQLIIIIIIIIIPVPPEGNVNKCRHFAKLYTVSSRVRKIAKKTINFSRLSVRPSICPHGKTGLHLNRFV